MRALSKEDVCAYISKKKRVEIFKEGVSCTSISIQNP